MFLARIRFFLVLLFVGLGIWLHIVKGLDAAWYLYLAAFILLLVHFLFSNVSAAFILLQKGRIDQAEQLLDMIKKPEWLIKRHQTYYHFTRGMIAMQQQRPQEAVEGLEYALNSNLLRTDTDNALAALNLAHLAYKANDNNRARGFMTKAKGFNSSDLLIREHLQKLEQVLGN